MRNERIRLRPVLLFLALVLLAFPTAARAGDILVSTFPVYLFTQNLVEGSDRFEPRLMIESSLGCPHDYAPTPADLERLSQAEVLVINGLGLEDFLPQALRVAKDNLKIIDASNGQAGSLAGEDTANLIVDRRTVMNRARLIDGPNPHLFAAPTTAALQVRNIAEGLAALDPDRAALYRTNASRLAGELEAAGAALRQIERNFGRPRVLASHGVFDFLADDAGFDIVATIEEADGVEPSAARLTQLAALARAPEMRAILVEPGGDVAMARTLGAETGLPVAVIDPVASGPADAPPDYYQKVMLTNAQVLMTLFAAPRPAPPAAQ